MINGTSAITIRWSARRDIKAFILPVEVPSFYFNVVRDIYVKVKHFSSNTQNYMGIIPKIKRFSHIAIISSSAVSTY